MRIDLQSPQISPLGRLHDKKSTTIASCSKKHCNRSYNATSPSISRRQGGQLGRAGRYQLQCHKSFLSCAPPIHSMLSRSAVLVIGVLFHLIYLRSIFDIYFKSPVVSVEEQFNSVVSADEEPVIPAKRLFLIVGDGLRADKLFENPQLAPFLHRKALHSGRWGISHTRVPTESRPGHVAMIAGLYEDVSAVTTGWQLNPIHFDSVFNQSTRTFSWGSPDILPMFREGATNKERINCSMYDPEAEDFTKESSKLDTWVFQNVNELFSRASADSSLAAKLKEPKTVYFLHLLGLDMAGHFSRPYSAEYLNNIANVDAGIENLLDTLEIAWGPEELAETAFLFTADHGMSDWGSHGDGDPVNTRTPYIAWGAGIKRPAVSTQANQSDSLALHGTENEALGWSVESTSRVDLAQADLAVLMSYLIGVNLPKNGAGSLPIEILEGSDSHLSTALFQNARQIHAQYTAKAHSKARKFHFSELIPFAFTNEFPSTGEALIQASDWTGLQTLSRTWIAESLAGMRYLQRYDWLFLRTIVTLGYTGWMLFAFIFVVNQYVLPYSAAGQAKITDAKIEALMGPKILSGPKRRPVEAQSDQPATSLKPTSSNRTAETVFVGLSATTIAFLAERTAPISYYAYAAFPLFFWYQIASGMPYVFRSLRSLNPIAGSSSVLHAFGIVALGMMVVQGTVVAYGQRGIITFLWPLASTTPLFYSGVLRHQPRLAALWTMLCFGMSTFTSLPTVQVEDIRFVALGGLTMVLVGIVHIILYGGTITMGAQIGLIALATIVTQETSRSLAAKRGLPLGNQSVAWATLVLSLLLPLFHRFERPVGEPVDYRQRLMILFLTFGPTFVILSISYEGIFYLVFWAVLVVWIHLETAIAASLKHEDNIIVAGIGASASQQVGYRGLKFSDIRIAIYFFFLIQAAFFGTGNIASVSSFSLDSVYRLIPVFSPFAMGSLLLFKLLVPFAVISATLGTLNRKLHVAPSALFMTVLTFCDLLTLNFFWLVKDEGSWLEIGSSISAFVIGGMLILFVISLEKISEVMVGDVAID